MLDENTAARNEILLAEVIYIPHCVVLAYGKGSFDRVSNIQLGANPKLCRGVNSILMFSVGRNSANDLHK